MKKLLLVALALTTAACVFVAHRVDVRSMDIRQPVNVHGAVKAHLKDGSTVLYPTGVTVTGNALEGEGTRYDLTLTHSTRIGTVPLDSVIGMESYRTAVKGAQTFIVSTLATAGGIFGGAALAVAIFGSCPTVYSADGTVEEAELFSSSIAPLFEGRDIDRLSAQPDARGVLTLELRNEALETHYINHLQLVEVTHAAGETVVPDADGLPTTLHDMRPPDAVTDRAGRDLRATLADSDGMFYLTDRRAIDRANASDMDDWIDVSANVAPGTKSTTLVFRLRNSLLNTVLLYDVMLGPAGAGALDWVGEDLTKISTAVELGRWHQQRAGLHISVWQDGAYREVARVPDSGPISWHDVAAVVPVPAGETRLRVRLSFLVDHLRIDRLVVGIASPKAAQRAIPLAEVTGAGGRTENEARRNMSAPDDRYLQTNPGNRFFARFNAGPAVPGTSRTFLLSSQGYYTEWIRTSWIQNATVTEPFAANDTAILTALRKWAATRDSFERRFMQARVPVQ